jgi:bifunctional aspartokinase / homoserine dehydrogenase 1
LKDLLVMKFGGTSMGSAERIRIAASISAEQQKKRPVVVVVSAMSKVTDLLLETLQKAESGNEAKVAANLAELRKLHTGAGNELLPEKRRASVLESVESLVKEFERIARGVLLLAERPPRSVDEAVAVGERLSALLIASYLESEGIRAVDVSGSDVIVTDTVFGNATPIMELTTLKATANLIPLLEAGVLPIVTGFNGATISGQPTTLGRGGSDFSASILAAALNASELWIWTDVDGIMSADPRLVKDAVVLHEVTYNEAAELAYNGAKVLHPRTLAPLMEKHIPIWSKNSFALEKPGTKIVLKTNSLPGPKAVTSMHKVALVSIEPASAVINGAQIMARALDALARSNTEVLTFSSSSYRQSFCFLVRQDELAAAKASLEANLALELTHGYLRPLSVDTNVGLLAVVGEGMQGTPGLAGRIFTAISRERVNIIAISQGSSELTIAIVVAKDGLETAVHAVHEECGLARLG